MANHIKLIRAVLIQSGKTALKNVRRFQMKSRLFFTGADQAERVRAERHWRGREEVSRLRRSDAVVVSFGKSGRTWLRVMISRLYQQVHDLPENTVIGFDNFHNMDRRIPRILFTHDTYIGDYTGHTDTKTDFYDKNVLLLVRDPRDVAVSVYFHLRYRTRPTKKALGNYRHERENGPIFDFVTGEDGTLAKIIDFMNLWARERSRLRGFEVLRYEDLRADPVAAMTRVAHFLDIPATEAQIAEAVEFASYENMKKKETEGAFGLGGDRVVPRDRDNPDSYKVRRAKVGGYRDYFDDAQVAAIDAMMAERLDPVYGYGPRGTSPH